MTTANYDFSPDDLFIEQVVTPAGTQIGYISVVTLGWLGGQTPLRLSVGLHTPDPELSVARVEVLTDIGWTALWQLTRTEIPTDFGDFEDVDPAEPGSDYRVVEAVTRLLEALLEKARYITEGPRA